MALNTVITSITIEELTENIEKLLRDIYNAIKRIRAARIAIDQSKTYTMLMDCVENFFVDVSDLEETISQETSKCFNRLG